MVELALRTYLPPDDTNTAIRFPAADLFTVETAGGERIRISAGGSFGVGINAPSCSIPSKLN